MWLWKANVACRQAPQGALASVAGAVYAAARAFTVDALMTGKVEAPPRVRGVQRPPQVEVRHAAPEVRVERANAQVEVTTQAPNVVFEHGEPEVVITREPSPLLPFSAVVGRTLLAEEGPRIGVIESVRIEVRTDRLYAIVMNSAGVTTAVPYPVLKRRGRFVTAPASISRRYRAENFAPVPPDRVIR